MPPDPLQDILQIIVPEVSSGGITQAQEKAAENKVETGAVERGKVQTSLMRKGWGTFHQHQSSTQYKYDFFIWRSLSLEISGCNHWNLYPDNLLMKSILNVTYLKDYLLSMFKNYLKPQITA